MLHPKDLTSCQSPCLMHSHGQGVFNVPHALSCIRSLQCHSSILMHKESSMTLKHSHSQGVFNIPHALSWQRSLQCPPPPCTLMFKESSMSLMRSHAWGVFKVPPSCTLMSKESSMSIIHSHAQRVISVSYPSPRSSTLTLLAGATSSITVLSKPENGQSISVFGYWCRQWASFLQWSVS